MEQLNGKGIDESDCGLMWGRITKFVWKAWRSLQTSRTSCRDLKGTSDHKSEALAPLLEKTAC